MTATVGTEITTLADLEALPVGAVVIDRDETAWQRKYGDWWYPTTCNEMDCEPARRVVADYAPLTVAWLPSETQVAR